MIESQLNRRFLLRAGLIAIPGLLLSGSSPDQRKELREFEYIATAMLRDTNLSDYNYELWRTRENYPLSGLGMSENFSFRDGYFNHHPQMEALTDASPELHTTYLLRVNNREPLNNSMRYSFTVVGETMPVGSSQQDLAFNNFHLSEVIISEQDTDKKFIFRWEPGSEEMDVTNDTAGVAVITIGTTKTDLGNNVVSIQPWILTVSSSASQLWNDREDQLRFYFPNPDIYTTEQTELIDQLSSLWLEAIFRQQNRSRLATASNFIQQIVPLLQQIS